MGLLGDLTAYIDNLKRRGANTLADLATNPLGLLSRNLSAFSESLPAAPDSVMPSGSGLLNRPGFQQWGMDVALNAPTMGLLGHTVYHGSPHRFDRFDASKIGTGEGAQAFGYGTYLAENPKVANVYRYVHGGGIPKPETISYRGKEVTGLDRPSSYGLGATQARMMAEFPDLSDAERDAVQWLITHNGDADKAAYSLTQRGKHEAANIAKESAGQFSVKKMSGNETSFYTVDLPDEWLPKMLDWDKPLSQQPEEVRKALEPYVAPIRKEMAKPADASWGDFAAPQKYDPTGSELLAMLRQQRDSMDAQSVLSNGLGPEVSQRLRDAGIPGIRYLDGGSRKSGEGTYNYVVFPGMEG